MKFFDQDGAWNWVDENNVVLGYRNEQQCCEEAGFYYTYEEPESWNTDKDVANEPNKWPDLSQFKFDEDYYRSLKEEESHDSNWRQGAVFRLFCDDKELFLVLFNHHNGYYSHGFTFKADIDRTINWYL